MRYLLQILMNTFKILCSVLLLVVFACLFFIMFLGAPISLLFETADIVRMDSTSIGVVTNVETKRNKEATSTQVTYQFTAQDQLIISKRVFPGFLGNKGGYSGSLRLADEFPIGKQCVVYYDASCPTRCSLKRGWFCWSIGFTAGVWGMFFSKTQSANPRIEIPALVAAIYGGGLLFVGPLAVQLHQIHWHLLSLLVIGVLATIYRIATRRRATAKEQYSLDQ